MYLRSRNLFSILLLIVFLTGCGGDNAKEKEKGFSVSSVPGTEDGEKEKVDGLSSDSLSILLKTKPGKVLLTGWDQYRLTAIFKINYRTNYTKKKKWSFIGSIARHKNYDSYANSKANQWNRNYMPGLEAVYGYNLVNISLNNIDSQSQIQLFESPVLIKTLYFPSFSKDTLNYEPVKRNYYLVTAFDEDTNKDGYVNGNDLRRFFWFDLEGKPMGKLLPDDFSVTKSEYDRANDLMYVYAQKDENGNGRRDDDDNTHVFWVDLKNPANNGRFY